MRKGKAGHEHLPLHAWLKIGTLEVGEGDKGEALKFQIYPSSQKSFLRRGPWGVVGRREPPSWAGVEGGVWMVRLTGV